MRTLLYFMVGVCLMAATNSNAQNLVSAFKDSELIGQYSAEFETAHLAIGGLDSGKIVTVEGSLQSRILRKPTTKSPLEVFRSYQNELTAAGFEIIAAREKGTNDVTRLVRDLSKPEANGLKTRQYTLNGQDVANTTQNSVGNFTDYYLAAKQQKDGMEVYIAVLIGRRNDLYIIDTLGVTPMETGTVVLELDALRAAIAATGKATIYDLYFDTGSASLKQKSEAALLVIATYLKELPQQNFYIVGHTDDTGDYDFNMKLSHNRAAAVRDALVTDHGVVSKRLFASGVGPLSPMASNANDLSRAQNRRVEIILRLQNPR